MPFRIDAAREKGEAFMNFLSNVIQGCSKRLNLSKFLGLHTEWASVTAPCWEMEKKSWQKAVTCSTQAPTEFLVIQIDFMFI